MATSQSKVEYVVSGGGGLVTRSCPTLVTPGTVAYQDPLSMAFPR